MTFGYIIADINILSMTSQSPFVDGDGRNSSGTTGDRLSHNSVVIHRDVHIQGISKKFGCLILF